MSRQLPPIDMHAHIDTNVSSRDLEGLGAVVFAATRSIAEFERTLRRRDQVTIWGIGCHPGISSAQTAFDLVAFQQGLQATPYVSEVGLDWQARVPKTRQEEIFRAVLGFIDEQPRIVSIHSRGATSRVVDLIAETAVRAPILHWWLGSKADTDRAIKLGCYFSVNKAMATRPKAIAAIPFERILTETDHPTGNQAGRGELHQPGWTRPVEVSLAEVHGVSVEEVRVMLWRNLSMVVSKTGSYELLPRPVQRMLGEIP